MIDVETAIHRLPPFLFWRAKKSEPNSGTKYPFLIYKINPGKPGKKWACQDFAFVGKWWCSCQPGGRQPCSDQSEVGSTIVTPDFAFRGGWRFAFLRRFRCLGVVSEGSDSLEASEGTEGARDLIGLGAGGGMMGTPTPSMGATANSFSGSAVERRSQWVVAINPLPHDPLCRLQ